MVVLIALTALRRNARTGQPILVDVVSDPTPKISRIFWQVIPGQVKVQLTWKRVWLLELPDGETSRRQASH